jgi:hypothetical protein
MPILRSTKLSASGAAHRINILLYCPGAWKKFMGRLVAVSCLLCFSEMTWTSSSMALRLSSCRRVGFFELGGVILA